MDLAFPEARTQVIAIIVLAFGILFSGQSSSKDADSRETW